LLRRSLDLVNCEQFDGPLLSEIEVLRVELVKQSPISVIARETKRSAASQGDSFGKAPPQMAEKGGLLHSRACANLAKVLIAMTI